MKQSITFEPNTIYCGDSAVLLADMPSNFVDLTVTSPPYDNLREYNGFALDWHTIIRELYRVTKPGGVVVWVVADGTNDKGSRTGTFFKQALYFMEEGFNLHQRLFYEKGGPPPDPTRYEETIEEMFVFSVGRPNTIHLLMDKRNRWAGVGGFGQHRIREADGNLGDRPRKITGEFGKRTSVWRYNTGKGYTTKDDYAFTHPAMFPEALARDHILSWSNPGDLVLDPFVGSGTVPKMAKQNGRHYIGIDISDEYCQLARQRVAWANPPLLVAG